MNEKYNSEKDLGKAFDRLEMPFDSSGFDAFKVELDKEEKRRKFIWWIYYGKILAPILILGFLIVAIVYLPDFNATPKHSSANAVNVNSVNESIEGKKQDVKSIELKTIIADQKDEKDSKQLNGDSDNHTKILNGNGRGSAVEKSISVNFDVTNNIESVNKKNRIVNKGTIPVFNQTLNQQDFGALKIAEQNASISGLNEDMLVRPENHSAVVISKVEDIALLNIFGRIEIDKLSRLKIGILIDPVTPLIEKYKSHFYFNMGVGISKEDNFGQSDPFFDSLNPTEFLWYGSGAFQFSDNTALEVGLLRKNLSLGFHLSEFTYREKIGSKVSILRARLIHKILSPSRNIQIHMTNGVAMVKSTSAFNEGFDFSDGRSGMDDPAILTNINLDYVGLYSKNHFMYAGGLSMDLNIFKNVDLNIATEYTLGFKSIMKGNLNYVAGEGVLKEVETNSSASFASISLGLKYRLRKD